MHMLTGMFFLLVFLTAALVMQHTVRNNGARIVAALAGPDTQAADRFIRVAFVKGPRLDTAMWHAVRGADIIPLARRNQQQPIMPYRAHHVPHMLPHMLAARAA